MSRSRRRTSTLAKPSLSALALLVAVVAALSASALANAATGSAGSEVLVGRYTGSTDQKREVTLRVKRDGGDLVVAGFASSLTAQCQGLPVTVTFGGGAGTVIGSDGHVKFTTPSPAVTVTIILGGPAIVGHLDYSTSHCHENVRFVAHLQPPDPIVQAGHYNGGTTEREEVDMHVEKKRGYFELVDFTSAVENCEGKKLGIDASPKDLIEDNGHVDFKTLGGRVKVVVNFHTRVHARGSITYSHGDCTNTATFVARLKPTT